MTKKRQMSRANRVLKENKEKGFTGRANKGFYALVDVRLEDKLKKTHETKTFVISGETRIKAEQNALTEIEVNGWKGKVVDVRPVAV